MRGWKERELLGGHQQGRSQCSAGTPASAISVTEQETHGPRRVSKKLHDSLPRGGWHAVNRSLQPVSGRYRT